ncbi:hypothetical protein FKW77_010328 [Venturia effusa]|uniref:Uncharacterized protein n=1 Tax=Venturia effusa TaxID=50376 RepID=A0A517L2B0_9PEZI|nr:hypothetical protein FKW77_010328 [Venturia effusa]
MPGMAAVGKSREQMGWLSAQRRSTTRITLESGLLRDVFSRAYHSVAGTEASPAIQQPYDTANCSLMPSGVKDPFCRSCRVDADADADPDAEAAASVAGAVQSQWADKAHAEAWL